MASKIILKKSSVAAKAPVAGDLEFGELAINYTDSKLYFKKADGSIDAFTSAAASAPVTSVGGNIGAVTDAQLLASIKNVDGTGSGLDADFLDGLNASAFYLASNPNGYTSNTGTVTSVGATAPLVSSGGTAPSISIPAANSTTNGYMSSAYAAKLDGIAAGATNVTNTNQLTNGAGYITSSFSGFMLRSTSPQSNPNTNFNSSGYRFDPNVNNPTNEHYAIVTFGNEGNVTGQIATHFQTGQTFTRAYNSSWSAWRTQIDSVNVASFAHTISTNPNTAGPGVLAIGNQGSYSFVQSHSGQPLNLNPVGNSVQIAGNTVLHAGNYTSYSPSLTGGGASGTWGINITGNAATATSADQIDGVGFRNTGSNSGTNADTIESNGITYYTAGVTNFSGNSSDGALYSQAYSSAWQHQIAGDYRSGQIAVRGKNSGTWQSWRKILQEDTWQGSKYFGSDGAIYGTIFYDANNGAYFVDPGGRSRQSQIDFGDGGYYIHGGSWGMRNTTPYGYIEFGPANSGHAHIYTDRSNFYFNAQIQVLGGSQINQSDIRANIFYDQQDTGYYIDGNSTSSLYRVNINNNILFTNYGRGMIGTYASTVYQAVFAMGDSYKLPDNGSTTGNLYGLAWSHPNAGGTAGNLNTHGLLVLENGGFLAAVSGSIRSRDDMRSPIFYDSNNTGYYNDPASVSYLYGLTLAGGSYFRPQNWIQLDGSYGLYWPNHYGAHLHANDLSTYTQIALRGGKNSYGGIYDQYSAVNIGMYDGGGNGGVYREANGRWFSYYHVGNDCWGFGTSSTSSAYNVYAPKGIYSGGRVDGTIFYDSSNTAYYLDPINTSKLIGNQHFISNRNTSSDTPPLQAYSDNGSGAIMAFHRAGQYAVNFGLDSDNVIRIGGWSASANRLQMDMSGNLTMAGNVTAFSDERLKADWESLSIDFIPRLAKVRSGTYTRIDSGERQAGSSAQDWQKLLPEVVTAGNDDDKTLALAYGNAALVSAIELAKRVVEQDARIAKLEERLSKLLDD